MGKKKDELCRHIYSLGQERQLAIIWGSSQTQKAPLLGAWAIKGAMEKLTSLENHKIVEKLDGVYMGNVISSGLGQAPARQAAMAAELGNAVPAITVGKVCGSGMQSVILAAQAIKANDGELFCAGGMENMSLAPHLLSGRKGLPFGPAVVEDSMQLDGLTDAYANVPMGVCAEECARKFSLSREEQDAFAIGSYKKAQKAIKEGLFAEEIIPVTVKQRKGEKVVDTDEGPFKANFEKMPSLRPVFDSKGSITAAKRLFFK